MKLKKLYFFTVFLLFGCYPDEVNHIFSPDMKQCITIITPYREDIRYIIKGYYGSIPDTNYVKLDISEIDKEIGDEIIGSWKNGSVEWLLMNEKALILESKLDTSKYIVRGKFPRTHYGAPTIKGYTDKDANTFNIGFVDYEITNVRGCILK